MKPPLHEQLISLTAEELAAECDVTEDGADRLREAIVKFYLNNPESFDKVNASPFDVISLYKSVIFAGYGYRGRPLG